ncbi:hypothetical protein BpHYR1_005905 [Brachionus plicatilis]|uniref:Uncharacterized protein n=1 Tax=Brachionus plicatilis TaxID=10195 RepID=A0A3M7RXC6_BRAPC|nr:hypothetical protein BpHYR1_005905 [Brachionus plicatilis]
MAIKIWQPKITRFFYGYFGSFPECDQKFENLKIIFKNRKRKGSFYKEVALVPGESFDTAKLAVKKH